MVPASDAAIFSSISFPSCTQEDRARVGMHSHVAAHAHKLCKPLLAFYRQNPGSARKTLVGNRQAAEACSRVPKVTALRQPCAGACGGSRKQQSSGWRLRGNNSNRGLSASSRDARPTRRAHCKRRGVGLVWLPQGPCPGPVRALAWPSRRSRERVVGMGPPPGTCAQRPGPPGAGAASCSR